MKNTKSPLSASQPRSQPPMRWLLNFCWFSIFEGLLAGCLSASAQSPPVITVQPQGLTNAIGTNATFTIEVTGTEPFFYQWQHANHGAYYVNLDGETNKLLFIASVQSKDAGTNRVIVSNSAGTVTSAGATLYIDTTNDPWISSHPSRQAPEIGGTATFVLKSGTVNPPLGVQWQYRASQSLPKTNLPGATNTSLRITNVTLNQAGFYSVVIKSYLGAVTNSDEAELAPDRTTFTRITNQPPGSDVANSWCASWGDYDGDGYADLFVARNGLGPNALYRNNRDGSFSRVLNLFPETPGNWVSGLLGDFENGGKLDLFLARTSGSSWFYFNEGDGMFSTTQFDSISPWSISTVDYDLDGLLDIYSSFASSGMNYLYRNLGGRSFRRMKAIEVGPIASVATFGGLAWADYTDDGLPDVFAAHYGANKVLMFLNLGGGKFMTATNLVTRDSGPALAGAWGDYDNDGRLDLAVARLGAPSIVYHNIGNGQFERASIGVTLDTSTSASWADYDNDGFLDLYLTTPNALYHNNGNGTFTKITTSPVVTDIPLAGASSYNVLWFDIDNDGFLDLFVANGNDTGTARTSNFLYRNNGNSNAWLVIKPVGTTSNRSAIGARVTARATFAGAPRTLRRDISSGDAFNGNHLYAHFGLGSATNVDLVQIKWPSGTIQELANVGVNQIVTITEPRRPVLNLKMRNGAPIGTLQADPSMNYEVSVSEDLVHWTPLTTLTTDGAGSATWSDPNASQSNARFYQAIGK